MVLFENYYQGKERIVANIYDELGKTIVGIFPHPQGSIIIAKGKEYKKIVDREIKVVSKSPKEVFNELKNTINI